MLGAALVCLASALASGATDDPAVSKFSVRNLSGGFIGLWWIDHRGRQLVAQSAVAVRHTSSVEINSFRGHRFVIRRLRRKARLADVPYEPRATDAVLEVGPTNDLYNMWMPQDEVMARGRWLSKSSVRCYGKPAGLLRQLAKLTTDLRKKGQAVQASLGQKIALELRKYPLNAD